MRSLTVYQALNEFKKDEVTKGYDDKTLLIYLFSRKMDVERSIKLLKNNRAWRTERGYDVRNVCIRFAL